MLVQIVNVKKTECKMIGILHANIIPTQEMNFPKEIKFINKIYILWKQENGQWLFVRD